jgi:hypothetical protein
MKVMKNIVKTAHRSSGGSSLTGRCSGAFVNEVKRSAFLVIILSVIVVLATGCSSTGTGSNVRLITVVPTKQREAHSENDGEYQPVRSPAFNDLFGS